MLARAGAGRRVWDRDWEDGTEREAGTDRAAGGIWRRREGLPVERGMKVEVAGAGAGERNGSFCD